MMMCSGAWRLKYGWATAAQLVPRQRPSKQVADGVGRRDVQRAPASTAHSLLGNQRVGGRSLLLRRGPSSGNSPPQSCRRQGVLWPQSATARQQRVRYLHENQNCCQPTIRHCKCSLQLSARSTGNCPRYSDDTPCLLTYLCTLRWAVLTVLWIGFCHTGPTSLCVDLFVITCLYFVSFFRTA